MYEYLRQAVLVAGAPGADGVEIKDLRMKFTVKKSIQNYPNQMELSVYNLSRATQTKFEKEYTKIWFFCGYQGSLTDAKEPKLIFQGNIKNVAFVANGKDVITTIYAGDADEAFSTVSFSQTFQGKSTLESIIRKLAQSFKDVKIGNLQGLENKFLPLRGFTLDGKTSNILNELAASYQFDWSIDNNIFTTIAKNKTLDKEAIVISSVTGLLDAPVVTESGVNVRSLLNPDYVPRGKVKIDTSASRIQIQNATIIRVPRTRGNGIFPIITVTHTGDTRGEQWESNIECLFFL